MQRPANRKLIRDEDSYFFSEEETDSPEAPSPKQTIPQLNQPPFYYQYLTSEQIKAINSLPQDQKKQYEDYYHQYFTLYLQQLSQQVQTIQEPLIAQESIKDSSNSREYIAPAEPAPQLPEKNSNSDGEEEEDPLDAFMAENDDEAFKDLQQSVVITKMDRMKDLNPLNKHQQQEEQENEILDQEDGLDALYDKQGNKMAKRKFQGKNS